MAVSDKVVMPLAREMLACLDQEIAKVENPPMYVGLRSGNVVAHLMSTTEDECCSGLAWVRPARFYPTGAGAFPAQDEAPIKGGTRAWGVTLELGVVRCAPTPDADQIPTTEEWDAVTQAVMDDGAAMRRAVCCFIDAKDGRSSRVLVGEWLPLDIEGGCVGGFMQVTVMGPACDCSEAGPTSS
jgi:hypothetical protein